MKLSIITVNKNNAQGLERTIQSVINQTFRDFEYVIIDGASTDNSVDVIKKYENKINYWISEPDTGIYNAMNKGIRAANGEYLLFLNSGDHLVNDTVVEQVFKTAPVEDIIYGNILLDCKEKIVPYKQITLKKLIKSYIPHPASFIKKQVFNRVGLYDEKYKTASDWKFFLEALILHNVTYSYIDKDITCFRSGGISTSHITENEKQTILKELFPRIYTDYEELFDVKNKYSKLKKSVICRFIEKLQHKFV